MKQIFTCPRELAVAKFAEFPGPSAVISIRDPDDTELSFHHKDYSPIVLYQDFWDLGYRELRDSTFNGRKFFTMEQAAQAFNFVQEHKDKIDYLLVHCLGGFSRSVGMGVALGSIYNIPVQHYNDIHFGNGMIRDMVLTAANFTYKSAFGTVE